MSVCTPGSVLTVHGVLAVGEELRQSPEGVLLVQVHEQDGRDLTHPLAVAHLLGGGHRWADQGHCSDVARADGACTDTQLRETPGPQTVLRGGGVVHAEHKTSG